MKILPLRPLIRGNFCFVDDDLHKVLSVRAWHLHKSGYACTKFEGKSLKLHRVIMGDLPGFEIDHKNRNKLDNTRANLRSGTKAQNQQNSTLKAFSKTRIKGVSLEKGYGYRARITVDKKTIYLGFFKTSKEAHEAYCSAAKTYFGEFACLQ